MAAGFRLRMATQAGEKLARDEGYIAFPVCPIDIAERHDIHVEKKPPHMKGVSGALIFAEPKPIIIYSTEHENEGFENFSVGHELGHYFLPDHPDEIIKSGGTHISRAGFSEGNASIEVEADHFSAGLLMPDYLMRKHLDGGDLGLNGIIDLAAVAHVSLTAAAIRTAQCAQRALCVIVSSGDKACYAFPSESFKNLGRNIFLRKGSFLPRNGATVGFNQDPDNVLSAARVTGECDLSDWFDAGRTLRLDEEVIGLGSYGLTLTVLSSEDLGSEYEYEEDDEEAALLDSWTPKF